MKIIKTVLIDDEDDSLKVSAIYLQKYHANVEVVGSFNDPAQALQFLKQHKVDLVLLDIEMPHLNGFDLLEQLGTIAFKVIFVTAYDRYMLKAIKTAAFDYLLKPIDRVELANAIERLSNSLQDAIEPKFIYNEGRPTKIIIPVGHEFQFINIQEIERCESSDNYTFIFLESGDKITISKTLKYFEETLPTSIFIRCHSKHLININSIKKYVKTDGGFFIMNTNEEIPISRSKKDDVLAKIGLK